MSTTMPKRMPADPDPFNVSEDKTGDQCAACGQGGDYRGKRALENVGGRRIMLCIDFSDCCKRYRRGMTPRGYATMLQKGTAPL